MTKLEQKKTGVTNTIIQIARMIASGKLPKELYDEYLSDTPIGLMNEKDLINFLTKDICTYQDIYNENKEYIKSLEKDLDKYRSKFYALDETIIDLMNTYRKVKGF